MTDRQARRLVVLGTLALAGWATWYVGRFAADLPNTDEWDFPGPVVAAGFPWGWLAEHHNEHRYPAARLLWLALVRAAGDFRPPMVLTVGLLAAAGLLLADAARLVRGRWSVGDLLPAALLLNGGNAFNFLMGYQVAFGLFAVGLAGVAWAAIRGRPHLGGAFAVLAGTCGGFGLAAAPPLAVWLLWEGRRRPAVWVWPLLLVGYCGWVADTMPKAEPVASGGQVVGTLGYLAVAVGPGVRPLGRPAWYAVGGVVLAVGLAAAWAARRRPGVLAVLAAGGLVAAAVGYGRGEWAVGDRFVTTSAVGPSVAWVVLGRRAGWVGLPLAVAVVGLNVGPALDYGRMTRDQNRRFEADRTAGRLAPVFLAGKHGEGFQFLRPDGLPAVGVFRDAGWPNYRAVPADPPFRLVPVALAPTTLACGPEPFLPGGPPPPGVPLGTAPPRAVGVRVRGEQRFPMGYQLVRVGAATAFPRVVPGRYAVTLPVTPGAEVRFEAGCPMLGLTVEAADWLVTP